MPEMADVNAARTTKHFKPAWAFGAGLFGLASLVLYLLPFTYPGERVILLVCMCGVWAAAVTAAWRARFLRVVTLALAALQLFPIRSGFTRLALITGFAMLWIGLLLLCRKKRGLAAGLAAAPLIVTLFLLTPGWRPDPSQLRQEYVRSLVPYRGAVYIWGGEN